MRSLSRIATGLSVLLLLIAGASAPINAVEIPKPIINIPKPNIPKPVINVPRPNVTVNVPKPVINVPRPAVTVSVPKPVVNVPNPTVTVNVPKPAVAVPKVDVPKSGIAVAVPKVEVPRPVVATPKIDVPRPTVARPVLNVSKPSTSPNGMANGPSTDPAVAAPVGGPNAAPPKISNGGAKAVGEAIVESPPGKRIGGPYADPPKISNVGVKSVGEAIVEGPVGQRIGGPNADPPKISNGGGKGIDSATATTPQSVSNQVNLPNGTFGKATANPDGSVTVSNNFGTVTLTKQQMNQVATGDMSALKPLLGNGPSAGPNLTRKGEASTMSAVNPSATNPVSTANQKSIKVQSYANAGNSTSDNGASIIGHNLPSNYSSSYNNGQYTWHYSMQKGVMVVYATDNSNNQVVVQPGISTYQPSNTAYHAGEQISDLGAINPFQTTPAPTGIATGVGTTPMPTSPVGNQSVQNAPKVDQWIKQPDGSQVWNGHPNPYCPSPPCVIMAPVAAATAGSRSTSQGGFYQPGEDRPILTWHPGDAIPSTPNTPDYAGGSDKSGSTQVSVQPTSSPAGQMPPSSAQEQSTISGPDGQSLHVSTNPDGTYSVQTSDGNVQLNSDQMKQVLKGDYSPLGGSNTTAQQADAGQASKNMGQQQPPQGDGNNTGQVNSNDNTNIGAGQQQAALPAAPPPCCAPDTPQEQRLQSKYGTSDANELQKLQDLGQIPKDDPDISNPSNSSGAGNLANSSPSAQADEGAKYQTPEAREARLAGKPPPVDDPGVFPSLDSNPNPAAPKVSPESPAMPAPAAQSNSNFQCAQEGSCTVVPLGPDGKPPKTGPNGQSIWSVDDNAPPNETPGDRSNRLLHMLRKPDPADPHKTVPAIPDNRNPFN